MTWTRVFVASSVVLVISGCARKREEEATPPVPSAAAPSKGVVSDKHCRYESVTAASSLTIGNVVAMDLPGSQVKEAFTCSGGPLQECGGMLPAGSMVGEASFRLTVDRRGFVTDLATEKDGGLPKTVIDCASQILRKIETPAPDKDGVTVRLSLAYGKRDDTRLTGVNVTVTSALASGKLDRADTALAASSGKLRACYLMALEADKVSSGTVRAKVTLGAKGEVLSVEAEQTGTLSVDTVKCVDTVLRAATYGAPDGGKAVLVGTVKMEKR